MGKWSPQSQLQFKIMHTEVVTVGDSALQVATFKTYLRKYDRNGSFFSSDWTWPSRTGLRLCGAGLRGVREGHAQVTNAESFLHYSQPLLDKIFFFGFELLRR